MTCPHCKEDAGFTLSLPIEGYAWTPLVLGPDGLWREEGEREVEYDILHGPMIACRGCDEIVNFRDEISGYEIETLERAVENVL